MFMHQQHNVQTVPFRKKPIDMKEKDLGFNGLVSHNSETSSE